MVKPVKEMSNKIIQTGLELEESKESSESGVRELRTVGTQTSREKSGKYTLLDSFCYASDSRVQCGMC